MSSQFSRRGTRPINTAANGPALPVAFIFLAQLIDGKFWEEEKEEEEEGGKLHLFLINLKLIVDEEWISRENTEITHPPS